MQPRHEDTKEKKELSTDFTDFHRLGEKSRRELSTVYTMLNVLEPSDRHQRRRVTVAEAESTVYPGLEHVARSPRWEDKWKSFTAQMVDGDELWEFCSDRASWEMFMGCAGYELVRDGKVVDRIATMRS